MEGDKISTLPTNENEKLQEPEQHLLDILLQDKKEDIKEIKNVSFAFKEAILGGLLFLLLSHSSFDNIVRMSGCKSELTVLIVKFAIFVTLYFILQNKFINVKKN
jgi:hypothetical protein